MQKRNSHFGCCYPVGFLARTATLTALACGIGLLIMRWVYFRDLGTRYDAAQHTLKNLLGFLAPSIAFCLLAVLFVASIAVFSVAMFASHKVAGPLFRIERAIGYIGRMTLIGRINLRAGDQGKPLASEINQWVDDRKKNLGELRTRIKICEGTLQQFEKALSRGNSQEIEENLAKLKTHAANLSRKNAK